MRGTLLRKPMNYLLFLSTEDPQAREGQAKEKGLKRPGTVAHTYNPSYLGGDHEDVFEIRPGKKFMRFLAQPIS
jgi:hypothetical protein